MERKLTITTQRDWKSALRQAGATASKGVLSGEYQGESLNFESPGAFFSRLTANRWAMLAELQGAGEVGVRELARRLGLAWRPGLLRRSQDQQDQKSLGRRARRMGVQGLYHCPGGVAGREVLVVDDVMTTGATLSAIADALQQQGAARIWAVVLARTRL